MGYGQGGVYKIEHLLGWGVFCKAKRDGGREFERSLNLLSQL